ncbi:hypothetical protein GSI_11475 [Ganoderma sinense ZZ0214-1]|uniref:HMG box domain-containing protein n=1 Tax=Ganoderma sinense ZZ0214-1 TaxID=1077348 RepID=A0A2G8RW34_9APHY|nr:hypothetical protein GSI_11475 [Ganoderma sinense ZZ0214-1]
MAPRVYTMRQGSFFRPLEWRWLNNAVLDTDVQEWLAKKDYPNARAVLVDGFHRNFTTPAEGETDEAFKKRRRGAKKSRKENIVRIRAESEEEFQTRMQNLPDHIGVWLANWRHRRARQGGKRWQPQTVPLPVKRKPRTITPFDAYCKTGPAPKGSDYADKRCNLGELRAARKAAWDKLSPDEQDNYRTVAVALMVKQEGFSEVVTEDGEDVTQEAVAHAEDIAAHVDGIVKGLHESVGWGGIAIFGGPDENGEGRMHITGVGTNRHGDTFLDVLLNHIGWTPLEFDTLFSLWVEQCRDGPQTAPNPMNTATARRAMDYIHREGPTGCAGNTPPYTAAVSLASDALANWETAPPPVFPLPVSNYGELDEASRRQHLLSNALHHLSLTTRREPSTSPAPFTADPILLSAFDTTNAGGGTSETTTPHDDPPALEMNGEGDAPDFPPPDVTPGVGEAPSVFASNVNYDPMCMDLECRLDVEHSDIPIHVHTPRPDCHGPTVLRAEGFNTAFEDVSELQTGQASTSQLTSLSTIESAPATSSHRNKRTEVSGVPMPGASGAAVVLRPMRARSTKSRQDTADGTLPLTAAKRGN